MILDLGFAFATTLALLAAWFAAKYLSLSLPRGLEYSLIAFFWTLAGATFVYASCILCLRLTELFYTPDQPTDYLARGRGWFGMIIMASIFSTCKFRLRFHPPEKPGGFQINNGTSRKAFVLLLTISFWFCIIAGLAGVPAERTDILLLLGSGVAAGLSASALFKD